jgi:hypothetical protein
MFTTTKIALSAALVLGTATAAAAMPNPRAHNPRAAFALQGAPAFVAGQSRVMNYDTAGVAIFPGQLTPNLPAVAETAITLLDARSTFRMGATTMSSETMIAIAAALAFGAATVALAMLNYEVNISLAPLVLQSRAAAACAENRPTECDTSGIFQWPPRQACPLSLSSNRAASVRSPHRKIEIRIRERLVGEREVPPLLMVAFEPAAGHRRGEQRAVLLRLDAHAFVRDP